MSGRCSCTISTGYPPYWLLFTVPVLLFHRLARACATTCMQEFQYTQMAVKRSVTAREVTRLSFMMS